MPTHREREFDDFDSIACCKPAGFRPGHDVVLDHARRDLTKSQRAALSDC